MKKVFLIVTVLLLASCSNDNDKKDAKASSKTGATPVAANPTPLPTSIMNVSNKKPEFQPNFISADLLLKKMNAKELSYVFDVRNKEAYEESHIKGALNRPIPITPELVKDIPKDAHIVTYCGCPHHLSGIAAEQLTNMGYKDVHVLNEGFWYWKDHKMPIVEAPGSKSTLSKISIEGTLTKENKPFANQDIYLKHELSGQLEATRTNADGGYKMDFHLYNYKKNDNFKFYVGDLRKPVQDFSTSKTDTSGVIVKIP
jgi:rhodanese-related sulfurtransferase